MYNQGLLNTNVLLPNSTGLNVHHVEEFFAQTFAMDFILPPLSWTQQHFQMLRFHTGAVAGGVPGARLACSVAVANLWLASE